MTTYDEACARATTEQGLDPVIAGLAKAGITAVSEQTGGFCMVATVYAADGWYLGVTDAFSEGLGYLVCAYSDDDDDQDPWTAFEDATLAEVVEFADTWLAHHGGARL